MTLDNLLTFALIAGAAYYLLRRFSKTRNSGGGCGCSSGGDCCAKRATPEASHSCEVKSKSNKSGSHRVA